MSLGPTFWTLYLLDVPHSSPANLYMCLLFWVTSVVTEFLQFWVCWKQTVLLLWRLIRAEFTCCNRFWVLSRVYIKVWINSFTAGTHLLHLNHKNTADSYFLCRFKMLTSWLTLTAFLAASANPERAAMTVAPTCRVKGHPEAELTLNCGDGKIAGQYRVLPPHLSSWLS